VGKHGVLTLLFALSREMCYNTYRSVPLSEAMERGRFHESPTMLLLQLEAIYEPWVEKQPFFLV
jgi:hypothetical protein